jgi:ribosome biogenesis GTPase A
MMGPISDEQPRKADLPENGIALARGTLIAVLTCLERIAAAQETRSMQFGVSLLRRKVEENRFYLTVVGQFKRGKSSFLNALLGAEVLPVAILPLTSIVTVLRYGASPRAEIVFQSGRSTTVGRGELADFITEKANPGNCKGVRQAEVVYPSEYLRGGVVLVDTPGIGSVYTNNTQVTYDFLPQVDAAIFVTSPDPPITNVEIEFLSDLTGHVNKVFVILNKADLLNRDQIGEVLDFTRRSLPDFIAARADSILAVSSTQALAAKNQNDKGLLSASGFALLEERLGEFLLSEKNQVFYTSAVRSVRKLIGDARLASDLSIRAARMSVEELRTRIGKLNTHLTYAEQQREESRILSGNRVAKLSKLAEAEAIRFAEEMVEPLRTEIRQHLEAVPPLGRQKLSEEMDRFLKERIESLLNGWRNQFEGEVSVHFQQTAKRFADSINDLIANVRQTTASLFGFSVKRVEVSEALTELKPCRYVTDTVLGWGLDNAPRLLPPGFFRPYLLRAMLRKVEPELQRNATRLAIDYKDRFNKSLTLLLAEINAKLDGTIDGIRHATASALARQQESAAGVHTRLAEWEAALAELDQCEDWIDRVWGVLNQSYLRTISEP